MGSLYVVLLGAAQGVMFSSDAGGLLTYGVRKSFYVKDKGSLESYVKVVEKDKLRRRIPSMPTVC